MLLFNLEADWNVKEMLFFFFLFCCYFLLDFDTPESGQCLGLRWCRPDCDSTSKGLACPATHIIVFHLPLLQIIHSLIGSHPAWNKSRPNRPTTLDSPTLLQLRSAVVSGSCRCASLIVVLLFVQLLSSWSAALWTVAMFNGVQVCVHARAVSERTHPSKASFEPLGATVADITKSHCRSCDPLTHPFIN